MADKKAPAKKVTPAKKAPAKKRGKTQPKKTTTKNLSAKKAPDRIKETLIEIDYEHQFTKDEKNELALKLVGTMETREKLVVRKKQDSDSWNNKIASEDAVIESCRIKITDGMEVRFKKVFRRVFMEEKKIIFYDESDNIFKETKMPVGYQVSMDDTVCHMVKGKYKFGNRPKKK